MSLLSVLLLAACATLPQRARPDCSEVPFVPTCAKDASPRCQHAFLSVDAWEARCGPAPAHVVLDSPSILTVAQAESLRTPAATVLDQYREPLTPQPPLSWSVEPEGIASIRDGIVTFHHSGDAMLLAHAEKARGRIDIVIEPAPGP